MPSAAVSHMQRKLMELGFNPGEIDGIWGRATIGALKRFQRAAGLEVDGVPGPMTRQALFGAASSQDGDGMLVWLQEALSLVGTTEQPGAGSNERIMTWARNLDIDYADDDVSWCGLFVAHCIGATLPEEPLPAAPLGARKWARFGDRCDPVRGAVLVFWRISRSDWRGHVGFYWAEDDGAYHVLGGNQSNAVNTARIPKSRLLDARWPKTARSLSGEKARGAATEPLSASEQ